ncbi:MAG: leucine-rich repeat protein [Eubacterium sp.]|nr:leucine-rich repeat protein [Eubacterium sp.]
MPVVSQERVSKEKQYANKTDTSGSCGNGVTWSYDNGTLNIKGSADMEEYEYSGDEEDIEEDAFPWAHLRSQITGIKIDEGVTTISPAAFWNCENLRYVNIAKSVSSIGEQAFFMDSSLTEVLFASHDDEKDPKKLQLLPQVKIGDYAFDYCESLESIALPRRTTKLGNGVFDTCENLTKIDLGKELTTIGEEAFANCPSLQYIKIPSKVTSVGNCAFDTCENLKRVRFTGQAPTFKGNDIFLDDKVKVYYPKGDSWEKVIKDRNGKERTYGAEEIEWIEDGIDWEYEDYDGKGVLYIHEWNEAIEEFEDADDQPWDSYRNITGKIIIDDEVEKIGNYAFSSFTGVRCIVFSGTKPSISSSAFSGISTVAYCRTDMNWDTADMLKYGAASLSWTGWKLNGNELVLSGSGEMQNLTGVQSDEPWDEEKGHITRIMAAGQLTSIGNNAFSGYEQLQEVIINGQIKTIKENAFAKCSSLVGAGLGPQVKTLQSAAFADCDKLKIVLLGYDQEGTGQCLDDTAIPDMEGDVFNTSSATVYYPLNPDNANVTKAKMAAFGKNMSWIGWKYTDISENYEEKTELDLEGFGSVRYAEAFKAEGTQLLPVPWFNDATLIYAVHMESGIDEIGDYGMSGMSSLEDITIRGNSFSIGHHAFDEDACDRPNGCSLTFEGSIERIEDDAFDILYCTYTNEKTGQELTVPVRFYDLHYQENKAGWDSAAEYKDYTNPCLSFIPSEKVTLYQDRDNVVKWNITNSSDTFCPNGEADGYYLSRADENIIKDQLSDSDYQSFCYTKNNLFGKTWRFNRDGNRTGYNTEDKVMEWAGCCFGLSNIVALTQNHSLTIPETWWAGWTDQTEHDEKSFINYFHFQQSLPNYMDAKKSYQKQAQEDQLRMLEWLMDRVDTENMQNLVSIDFSWYDSFKNEVEGHQLVAYALERGTFYYDGEDYTGRVLTYDPNEVETSNLYNYHMHALYYKIDGSKSKWIIPGYDSMSTSNKLSKVFSSNNAMLKMTSADERVIYPYTRSGEAREIPTGIYRYSDRNTEVSFADRNSYLSVANDTIKIAHENVTHTVGGGMIDNGTSQTDDGYSVMYETGEGSSSRTDMTVIALPDSEGEYTVTADNALNASILFRDKALISALASKSGTTSMQSSGTAKMDLTAAGSGQINIIPEERQESGITFSGDELKELSVAPKDEGYLVGCDNLRNFSVQIERGEEEHTLSIITDEKTIYVKPGKNEEEDAVFTDPDGDGEYDNPIDVTHKAGNPVFKWADDYKTASATFRCTDCNEQMAVVKGTIKTSVSAATTAKEEITVYIATFTYEGKTWTDTKQLVTGPKLTPASTPTTAPGNKVSTVNPTMQLNVSGTLPMQVKQKSKAVKVTGLTSSDYVKSVTSSNNKVVTASYSGGTITLKAKKTGKSLIRVTLASGLQRTFTVKVQKKKVTTKAVTAASGKIQLKKGRRTVINPVLKPVTSQDKVTYKSSNSKVAAVTGKGIIKAKKPGKAKITIKAGKKKKVIKVTVTK